MKRFGLTALAAVLLTTALSPAYAQPYQGQRDDRRDEQRPPERHYREVERNGGWQRGQPMRREDWARGRRFDYHGYGLREPPPGYEWREVDGVFVLGAIATGIIASILLQPH